MARLIARDCGSADYRLAPANAKPAFDELKDGVSCNVCHTAHSPGKAPGLRLVSKRRQPLFIPINETMASKRNIFSVKIS